MVAKAVAERILIDRPLSVHVKGVRVRKDILISIGGLVRRNDALAGFDELKSMLVYLPSDLFSTSALLWGCYLSTQLHVNFSCALYGQSGPRMEPSELLDESRSKRWVLLQLLKLRWILEQRDNALKTPSEMSFVDALRQWFTYESDHVHHGSISRNEEQKRNLNGVRLLNVAGLHLLHNKAADEVILRFSGTIIDQSTEVVQQLSVA